MNTQTQTAAATLPSLVTTLDSQWSKTTELFADYSAKLAAIYNGSVTASTTQLDELQQSNIDELCRLGESTFAAPGARLTISREIGKNLETFTPTTFWQGLVRVYGNQKGQTESFRNTCKALRDAVELHRYQTKRDVKAVSGRFVLTLNHYSADEWNYNYRARETTVAFLQALKCVSMWGGLWTDDQEDGLQAVVKTIDESRQHKDARDIGQLRSWSPLVLVPFKSKIEFRITPELATQIQAFLNEFDPVDASEE